MEPRINYPDVQKLSKSCGQRDGAAITSSQSGTPLAGNGNGSGPSSEERGGGGSNPSPRTIFPATKTPEHIARQMCNILQIKPGQRVLEPSAGDGVIVRIAREFTQDVTAIELNPQHIHALQCLTAHVYKRDFLRLTPDSANVSARGIACRMGLFNKIVMCPPQNSDEHISHAEKFLAPGGTLIALVQEQNVDLSLYGFYTRLPEIFQYNDQQLHCGIIHLWA